MSGALHQPVRITVFPSTTGMQKQTEFISLADFVTRIPGTVAPRKDALPLLKIAAFGEKRSSKKSFRHDANVLECSGVELDYDGEALPLEVAAKILRDERLFAIIYTSPSYTLEKPRWRILAPFGKPLPPAERARMVARLAGLFAVPFAAESWTLSQSYFYGSIEGQPPATVVEIEGVGFMTIDQRDDLDGSARHKPQPGASKGNHEDDPWAMDTGLLDVEQAYAAIRDGSDFHNSLLSLAGHHARLGMSESDIVAALRTAMLMRAEVARDGRWQERDADIPRLVDWVMEKERERRAAEGEPDDPWTQFQASSSGQSEPTLPPLPPEPDWPQPIGREAHRQLLGEIVDATDLTTEGDINAILLQHLVFFGNALGISDTTPWCWGGRVVHRTNLFTLAVGATAYSRKGTATAEVSYIYRLVDLHWEKNHCKTGLSSGEGLITAVRDEEAHIDPKTGDVVIDHPASKTKNVLFTENEFGRTAAAMQRQGNTLDDLLKQAWDGNRLGTQTKSPMNATGHLISVIAHDTFVSLTENLPVVSTQDGFGNRFLLTCVKRSKSLPSPPAFDQTALAGFVSGLQAALRAGRLVGEMTRTAKAEAAWRDGLYEQLNQPKPGLYGALVSRGHVQVLRMSMIFALLEQRREIGVGHLEAASAVWRFCADSVRYLFGERQGSPIAEKVLDELRHAPDGLTRTQLHARFNRHLTQGQLLAALIQLLRDRLVYRVMRTTSGRPAEAWLYGHGGVQP
jgi:hypothetical protein